MKTEKRQYNVLGRRLLSVLREGGPRKYAVCLALARHWGYTQEAFRKTIAGLKEQRLLLDRRRQGGIHLQAAP